MAVSPAIGKDTSANAMSEPDVLRKNNGALQI